MAVAVARRSNGAESSDPNPGRVIEPISRRLAWSETVSFPDNPPISEIRIARLRRQHGGYEGKVLGTPEVADNAAGAFPEFPPETLFVLDGNNRRRIAELEGALDKTFIARLWRGLTRRQMHEVCRGVNSRRTIKPAEDFKRSVAMGDARRKRIAAVVEECGWEISYERQDGGLSCTRELEWIWGDGRQSALVRTLTTYEAAFGMKSPSGQGNVIKGIGAFWILYPDADQQQLVSALDGLDVKKLYDAARSRRTDLAMRSLFNGFVDVLRHRYDRGLRGNRRLPERRLDAAGKGWTQ